MGVPRVGTALTGSSDGQRDWGADVSPHRPRRRVDLGTAEKRLHSLWS